MKAVAIQEKLQAHRRRGHTAHAWCIPRGKKPNRAGSAMDAPGSAYVRDTRRAVIGSFLKEPQFRSQCPLITASAHALSRRRAPLHLCRGRGEGGGRKREWRLKLYGQDLVLSREPAGRRPVSVSWRLSLPYSSSKETIAREKPYGGGGHVMNL